MEITANIPDFIRTLNVAELLIRRGLALADATPFVAHCEMTESDRSRFASSFRNFVKGDASRIPEAFRRWPLASVWNFAIALSQDYGEDGHAVYAVLERTFGVAIIGEVRNRISDSFRAICRKHGLCYDGSGRLVDDYLAQAGIANSQLHHIARAFLFAERALGPPPHDNTAALNSWEDDAAYFVPFGVNIPRMVLEIDETAHYAFLFTRFREREDARNEFEKLFFSKISEAENSISAGQRSQAVPRPSLIWSGNGLALSLPKLEGRLSVSVNGTARKLRGGQHWPLPTPWPNHVDWSFGDHSERLSILPGNRHMLAFEHEFGRLAGQVDAARDTTLSVDAREIVLVAACPFAIDGEPAFGIGLGGYATHCLLGPATTTVEIDSRRVQVRAKPKPRIWIESGAVAKGPRGFLLSSKACLGIESGELGGEQFDLALSIGDRHEIVPVTISSGLGIGYATHQLSTYPAGGSDLVPVRAELRLSGSSRALVRYKAWLWPSLREIRDELIFDSDKPPSNYSPDHSRHITTDRAGHLRLDTEAAYETATLTFLVAHERVSFDIPRPGVSLLFTDAEGRSLPLRIGETLIVRDEDKSGSLAVRCPDALATLTVRGRVEPQAFKRTPTRVLSMAELITPAPRDDVTLQKAGAASVVITLARVVPALFPHRFSIERKGENLALKIEMQGDIDALRLSLEDETGNREDHDCALGFRPVSLPPAAWLSAKLDPENARRVLATIDPRKFCGQLSLANLLVRPAGSESFRPLRNPRGDSYAIVLKPLGEPDLKELAHDTEARKRFLILNTWMYQCFSPESWEHVGPHIQPRWLALGAALAEGPDGPSLLLSCAHLPPQPGAARSWVPLAHPLQIVPALYGSPLLSFLALAADVSEGSEHLALLAETAGKTIPEIHNEAGLSPAFLMAFGNFAKAHKSGVQLRGFDFEKYTHLFHQLDTNPGARWFWRPGEEMLGPAHYE